MNNSNKQVEVGGNYTVYQKVNVSLSELCRIFDQEVPTSEVIVMLRKRLRFALCGDKDARCIERNGKLVYEEYNAGHGGHYDGWYEIKQLNKQEEEIEKLFSEFLLKFDEYNIG